jgi:hypothetical protein
MQPLTIARRTIAVAAVAVVAGSLMSAPAQAAAPTKIRDRVTTVACRVDDGSTVTRFAVARSELAGTEALVQVAVDGEVQLEGYGTSDWTDSGFRASVALEDASGGGHAGSAGDAYLSGSYRVTGTPNRVLNRFKDGNIRVVEDHTTTELTVTDVVLTINGRTLDNVSCQADTVDGYLFFTAPSSYVLRGGFLTDTDCATQNMNDLGLFGTMDALSLSFGYADTADSSASSGDLDLTAGPWSGEFAFNDGTGPAGTVAATVSAVQDGDVIRSLDRSSVVSERWVVTPYQVTIIADGPVSGASATCQVYDVDATLHIKTGKLGS